MAHVLVIDDEPAMREIISLALTAVGHQVTVAADGCIALKLLRSEPVDLILTDLVMPEQDGVETIMALRHLAPDLPVIAMSGDVNRAGLYLEIAKHLGVRHTLAKPFTVPTLIGAVDQVLERSPVT